VGGGAATMLAATDPVNATGLGAVGADEFGNLFLGEGFIDDIFEPSLTKIPASGLLNSTPAEIGLGSPQFNSIHDVVHDGNHHLFVTDSDYLGHGKVWRFNLITGTPELFTDTRGPAFGNDSFNELHGITLDASGDLWVVEQYSSATNRAGLVKINGRTGQVLGYFAMDATLDGEPFRGAQPWGIAVYGVNLPAVRERCAGTCSASEVSDCYGGCLPAASLGDGVCDTGPGASFNCYARGFDGDACNPCSPTEVPDCEGNCAPKGWIGDSICDAGGWQYNGNWINYDCPAFRFDEATCVSCNANEMLDCNGNCAPAWWLGDDYCDAGGYSYFGNYIDFNCVEYDFDQNTCQ
jgi:hypothetical protein